MWRTWLKTSLAGLLAFAAVVGLAAVLRDRPYVYPAVVRLPWLSGQIRATPRHVALAVWRTPQHDLRGSGYLYWEGAGLQVYTNTASNDGERMQTDFWFATADHSARVGELGLLHGIGTPTIPSYTEVLLPTWLTVAVGMVPLVVVIVGRVRRRRQFLVGHCRRCGYDLRATTGRCPECGASVPAAKVATSA